MAEETAVEETPMDGAPPATPAQEESVPTNGKGLMGQAAKGDEPPAEGEPQPHPHDTAPPEPTKTEPGTRPEYILEQFWDKSKGEVKIEALAKSYSDSRKENNTLIQNSGGKPLETAEEYLKDFVPPSKARGEDGKEGAPLDRFGEGLDAEDPGFQAAAKAAHKVKMPKKMFDEFIPTFMEETNDLLPKPINMQEELESLGDNGEQMVKTNVNWINSLKSSGVLNQDQYDLLLDYGATAIGVELVNAIRINSGERPIPMGESVNKGAKTPAECQAMMADKRYHEDGAVGDAYRAEVDKAFAATFGTESSG